MEVAMTTLLRAVAALLLLSNLVACTSVPSWQQPGASDLAPRMVDVSRIG